MSETFCPEDDIDHVIEAHERLLRTTKALTDEDVRMDSLLSSWSIGHVLTHLARNADSHVRRVEAAIRGEVADQYDKGSAGRDGEIEIGSVRPAEEMLEDLQRSCARTVQVWQDLPFDAWLAKSKDTAGRQRFLFELPARRWQEVEVHLSDLGIGPSWRDWSDAFVSCWLPATRDRMWDRLSRQAHEAQFDDPREELAWLYGREKREGLPVIPPWG